LTTGGVSGLARQGQSARFHCGAEQECPGEEDARSRGRGWRGRDQADGNAREAQGAREGASAARDSQQVWEYGLPRVARCGDCCEFKCLILLGRLTLLFFFTAGAAVALPRLCRATRTRRQGRRARIIPRKQLWAHGAHRLWHWPRSMAKLHVAEAHWGGAGNCRHILLPSCTASMLSAL